MTDRIEFDDVVKWHERLDMANHISVDVQETLAQLKQAGKSVSPELFKESQLYVEMVRMTQQLWDVTETLPGEAAGLTLEPASQEERVQLREQNELAISLGEPLGVRLREALG